MFEKTFEAKGEVSNLRGKTIQRDTIVRSWYFLAEPRNTDFLFRENQGFLQYELILIKAHFS
jgi:hypothetical protein